MISNNAGYLLNNRYRVVSQIGEGGMANVYLATDTILNRNVAVKVLRGDLSHDETFVKRFQREALASTALEHPNLVQVFDVGEEQGYHYIVMEYIEGKTLKQLIRQHGPLSVGEVIDVMEQLVSAVEHAHSRHVIHRDIKPQNVIVRNDGTVKLTDFGIAVAQNAAQLTQTNSIMGSVHYLAPEIARGQAATVQSDIYSLGILMFELLSGNVPFAGDSAVNIALMHMEERMPSIRAIVGPDVNQAVENIILKSTTKNQNNRYNSAHEMLLDLVNAQYREDEPMFVVDDDYTQEPDDDYNTTIIMDRDEINAKTKKKMSKKTKKMLAIGAVVLALIIGIAAYFAINGGKSGIMMPDVVNLKEDEAKEALTTAKITEEEGFLIRVEPEESETVDVGKVIETNPVADTELDKKATIILKVSKGKEITLEDYTGMYQNEVEDKLKALGLKTSITTSQSNKTAYTVLSTSPGSGAVVQKGDTVRLTIAVPEEKTVSSVVGFTYASAYKMLQDLGLVVTGSNCTEDSIVKSQSVAAGRTVQKGKKIKLTCEPKEKEKDNTDKNPVDGAVPDATPKN